MKQATQVTAIGVIAMACLMTGRVAAEAPDTERLQKPAVSDDAKAWVPVKRTTEKIVLVEQDVMKFKNNTWKLDFYRNNAYKCGLSGNYTFLVGVKCPHFLYQGAQLRSTQMGNPGFSWHG